MEPEKYKTQFIEFLKTVFPSSLPDDINAISLSNNNNECQYRFIFDPSDYNQEKTPKKKNKTAFEERLTESDLVFLKQVKVCLEAE